MENNVPFITVPYAGGCNAGVTTLLLFIRGGWTLGCLACLRRVGVKQHSKLAVFLPLYE